MPSSFRPLPDDSLSRVIHDYLVEMLDARLDDTSICPSETARLLGEDLRVEWRDLMRPIREIAARLAEEGRLEVVQDGQAVNIRDARGPVRLRRKPRPNRQQSPT
ncbi:MAG: DUF3253 domain-containing protein [Ahniella sp.]|nr:DUF3253 domain-containing protein [Ahniella sp.]